MVRFLSTFKVVPFGVVFILVSAFALKEKSPTITVGSFFSTDNLTLNGPLFLQFLQSFYFLQFLLSLRSSIFTSKKLNGPKGTPLEYFRLCKTFFGKKFSPKGPPFNFLIFSDRMDVEKSRRAPPPFSFFRHTETFFQNFFS